MYKEILNNNQIELLDLLSIFKREFYLVGGTAIALYIGHRRSIDFDMFKQKSFNSKKVLDKIYAKGYNPIVTRRVREQLNLIINDVKFTFFEYPYSIVPINNFENFLRLPSLLDLAAMKAFALGRRSKWKDYVDLFFLLKDYFSISEISNKATELFDQQFSEKLFRAQLSYFKDIDYTEEVEYLVDPVDEETVKNFLIEKAIDF